MLDLSASIRGRSGSLPISAAAVAREFDLAIRESSDPASFGSTRVLEDGTFEIIVVPDMALNERNFTIAHEIGHVFLYRASGGRLVRGESIERLCDLFGAYLLAPVGFVDERLRDNGLTIGSVARLAEILNISQRGLWTLITEHYPLSFWWKRMGYLEWIGQFDVDPFAGEVHSMCTSDEERNQSRIHHVRNGITEWILECTPDQDGGYGILKPTGVNVRETPVVRSINFPRERLFAGEPGKWTSHEDRNIRRGERQPS
jgi:hypothetical protein